MCLFASITVGVILSDFIIRLNVIGDILEGVGKHLICWLVAVENDWFGGGAWFEFISLMELLKFTPLSQKKKRKEKKKES